MPKSPKWNELPCPECKEPVAAEATRCPHCQAVFDPAVVADRKEQNKRTNKHTAIGCGVFALALVLGVAWCSAPVSVPDEPGPTAAADGRRFFDDVMTQVRPCDEASGAVGTALASGDLVESYSAARDAKAACLGVRINEIEVPTTVGRKAHGELTDARETCDNAYVSRWSSMSSLTELLSGEGGVASLADARDDAERSSKGVLLCVAGLMGPLVELGVGADAFALKKP